MSVILSRALSGAQFPYSLVPVLDFLNHSLHPTALHRFDTERQLFEVVAATDHADGDEVYLDYGALPNDRCGHPIASGSSCYPMCQNPSLTPHLPPPRRLLHLYGFALRNNPHNRAVLSPACGPVPPAMTPMQAAAAVAAGVAPLSPLDLSVSTDTLRTHLLPLARTLHLAAADVRPSLVDCPSQVSLGPTCRSALDTSAGGLKARGRFHLPCEPTTSTLNIIWSCGMFEGRGSSTSRVSLNQGPLV
jgi:hypothetical protein